MAKPGITDTTLRDAHQSLWATRMSTDDMIPILKKLDSVGYFSLEVWGGATFDVCMRYLNEDPWERLRTIRKHLTHTPLQMLLRGQSLVGYQHYPDDVVEAFIGEAVSCGIDIIRIFDALNDVRNFEAAIKSAKKEGAHIQAAVVYTLSPVHTRDHFVDTAMELAAMGADSICIKDMAGLLTPFEAPKLVGKLKQKTGLKVSLHSHYIGGMALGSYLRAIEAGVDVVDTATTPLAFGASQPPVETLVRALKDTPYDTGMDISLLFEIADHFERLRKEKGYERAVTRINDMRVFEHQVPGGMISNLVSQLREQNAAHRLGEVLDEIPRVRKEFGFPPLVTPTSQIVGIQAVLNVLSGERYKLIPNETKMYFKGLYGKPPAPLDHKIREKVLRGENVISCRPADILKPELAKRAGELEGLSTAKEDIISCAMFPQLTHDFIKNRSAAGGLNTKSPRGENKMNLQEVKELLEIVNKTNVTKLALESEGVKLVIDKNGNGNTYSDTDESAHKGRHSKEGNGQIGKVTSEGQANADEPVLNNLHQIKSPMVGTFYSAPSPDEEPYVKVNDQVRKGQTLCIVEAMKLMNEIKSDFAGRVVEALVENGQGVEYGQPLFTIKPLN